MTIPMNERLLQFIWQFQYYNCTELATIDGESLHIIFPGHYNTNQGPDFSDGKIRIDQTVWAGTIELHLKTSDWIRHHHQSDTNYNNVILHVVWENDGIINNIPLVELKDRISTLLLQHYGELMNRKGFIPCENNIVNTNELTWKSWKDRLLAERLMRKTKMIEHFQRQNNDHWEETFWWLLARNFGMKINAEAFEEVARSIPITLLSKHRNSIHQLEAMLLGQAGLLANKPADDYALMLQKEYQFYQNKYQLASVHTPMLFLRMRPINFPTVRLAQLAMLVHNSTHLFTRVKEGNDIRELKKWLDITANDYWHYHYRFDEASEFKKKNLGDSMMDNIIINTISPVLFAYGNYHCVQLHKEKAVLLLEETPPENNSIVKGFMQLGIENKNAFDSQALIELKNEYCEKRRCLDCAVGNYLLKKDRF